MLRRSYRTPAGFVRRACELIRELGVAEVTFIGNESDGHRVAGMYCTLAKVVGKRLGIPVVVEIGPPGTYWIRPDELTAGGPPPGVA